MKYIVFFLTVFFTISNTYGQTWEFLGPVKRSGGYWGMGRVTDIDFHPTNPQIFYVSAPLGGLWKTTDGGRSYQSIGDDLPYNAVGNVVVSMHNPAQIHISLGDRMGWWNYGMGVYYSENGGKSWVASSLTSQLADKMTYIDMKGSPHIENLLLVATNTGLYRTTDGRTFSLIKGLPKPSKGRWRLPIEIAFHTTNPNIVYLVWIDNKGTNLDLFKSEDAGLTWKNCTNFNFTSYGQMRVGVTPANPSKVVIYTIVNKEKKVHYSLDNGETWQSNQQVDLLQKRGQILVSPTNEDVIYTGHDRIIKSEDNGKTFRYATTQKGEDYVHLDQWVVKYNTVNNKIYWGNDGGVYEYDEKKGTWRELSDGLAITQISRTAIAQSVDDTYFIGTQDNGAAYYSPSRGWVNGNGGDAVSNAIHPQNENLVYSTYPSGREFYRSVDGMKTKKRIGKNIKGYYKNADWNSPFDLCESGKLFIAAKDVYLSEDEGETWKQLSFGITEGEKILDIQVSRADEATIYAIIEKGIIESNDGGKTWQKHVFPSKKLKRITTHPTKINAFWLVQSDYKKGEKVYYSIDRGLSFRNISGNLPNIPVLSLVYDEVTNYIFIGTELGVYFTNADQIEWKKFGEGLPNTSIRDLDIHKKSRKLYASTYGRGLWRVKIGGL